MRKKILVIDDDEGILAAFEALLESEGYSVKISDNIEPLLALTQKNAPNLVLLDVLLSGTDGRNICKILKKQPNTRHIPIIMISAHPSVSSTIKEAGADDFIHKPFEMKELLTKISKYVNK